MDSLPDGVVSNILRRLTKADLANLRLSGSAGSSVVRRGCDEAAIPWGGRIDKIASAPKHIRVIPCLGHKSELTKWHSSWLMNQWPSSATTLEWDGTLITYLPASMLVDDARVREQSVVTHYFALPSQLPSSVRSISCNVLEGADGLTQSLPHVRTLTTSCSTFRFTEEMRFSRLPGLVNVKLAFVAIGLVPPAITMILKSLAHLRHLEVLVLKGFSGGQIPDLSDGGFPALRSLTMDSAGGWEDGPTFHALDNLNACPHMTSLAISGFATPSLGKLANVRELTLSRFSWSVLSGIMDYVPGEIASKMPQLRVFTGVCRAHAPFFLRESGITEMVLVGGRVVEAGAILGNPRITRFTLQHSEENLASVCKVMTPEWRLGVGEHEVLGRRYRVIRLCRASLHQQVCG